MSTETRRPEVDDNTIDKAIDLFYAAAIGSEPLAAGDTIGTDNIADDPFTPTPPTPAEQARVESEVALLTAAADPIRLFVAAGNPERWLPELSALLADLAEEGAEVGPNPRAAALARKILGEQR